MPLWGRSRPQIKKWHKSKVAQNPQNRRPHEVDWILEVKWDCKLKLKCYFTNTKSSTWSSDLEWPPRPGLILSAPPFWEMLHIFYFIFFICASNQHWVAKSCSQECEASYDDEVICWKGKLDRKNFHFKQASCQYIHVDLHTKKMDSAVIYHYRHSTQHSKHGASKVGLPTTANLT